MVFLSYSRLDTVWRDRFLATFKPLERYEKVDPVWSDRQIEAGDNWRNEIDKAMDKAVIAVLLVSINFLNSDFVCNVELPYILGAVRKRNLRILWVRLTPCYFEATPLRDIQAAAGMPKPLNGMGDFGWMEALCKVCDEIDTILRKIETPTINSTLKNRPVRQKEPALQVLAKPAPRETEVLVYAGNAYWYTQSRIPKGSMTATCWFGNATNTGAGAVFKIVALTRGGDGRLPPGSKFPNIPPYRAKSQEVSIKRK
jgi:hypothetical protein